MAHVPAPHNSRAGPHPCLLSRFRAVEEPGAWQSHASLGNSPRTVLEELAQNSVARRRIADRHPRSDPPAMRHPARRRPGQHSSTASASSCQSACASPNTNCRHSRTLFVGTLGPTVTNKFLYRNMGYEPDRAFAPIMLLGTSPMIMVGSPKIPPTNLKELLVYAKDNPGKLNAGTVGPGSHAHITLTLINKLAGTQIVHVPYRMATQALPDLISGDLQAGFNYIPTFVPAVKAGTIRGLAVTSTQRVSDLPDVPTVEESGFPGFEASGWTAMFAPAGTPPDIIAKVNTVLNDFLNSDAGKAQVETKLGMTSSAARLICSRPTSRARPPNGGRSSRKPHQGAVAAYATRPVAPDRVLDFRNSTRDRSCNDCRRTPATRICTCSAMPRPTRSTIRTRSTSRRRTAPSRP